MKYVAEVNIEVEFDTDLEEGIDRALVAELIAPASGSALGDYSIWELDPKISVVSVEKA